ncbi:MAG TPA: YceI family protein [Steroidobacteraceae bacterium]|nr:YceI family protein [Steroidobacteraceae bacterium]
MSKLMRVNARWKLLSGAALSLVVLSGCPTPPRAPTPAVPGTVSPAPQPAPHVGAPYDVVGDASLLTVLVYRGGALSSAGHNHVIASHDLGGTVYVAHDPLQSSFEVHVPVATLTVDEASLRAGQSGGDFPPDVPASAQEGTRHNMLGPALLDAEHHPEIVLRALSLERAPGNAADTNTVVAHVQSTVRDQVRTFAVPVHWQLSQGTLDLSGTLTLRQSELGLTPFSAMLGALQVQDEMHVTFHIVAHAAAVKSPDVSRPP